MIRPFLILALLLAPAVQALELEGREISRANMRQIQRDQHFRRVEKTFNTVFYRRHFETAGEPNELHAYLVATAKLYDISPEAVLGAIMAEHSMNSRSQMKRKGEAGINFIGKTFGSKGEDLVNDINIRFRGANGEASFGPGQIQPFIADSMQAEIERIRPDATEEERDKYTWKGAINIICAYMNYAANAYEANGIPGAAGVSIRQDPALIATLFNLGEQRKSFAQRAEESLELKAEGKREGPWINYFGYWIQKHHKMLADRLGEQP